MSDAQREVVGHDAGAVLVIAGPGSGKTFSLVLRTINLLLLGKAEPSQLIVCTFTEKAAYELRDRIAAASRRVGYNRDLSELNVGTIHGVCNGLLQAHRHRTPLGNNYDTLDDLTQLLFLFEHFGEIVGAEQNGMYLGKWRTKWSAIEGLRDYLNKITEELIDVNRMSTASSTFLQELGRCYQAYQAKLFQNNKIDFAFQQKLVHDLLLDRDCLKSVNNRIHYVMVDEYQDTNYIQEQVLTQLASGTGNLCVVGDEDQSIYRFRGATVRNILEFPSRFPNCRSIQLTTNYRSHEKIVTSYDRWMRSANWTNPSGPSFRFDKSIAPDPNAEFLEYPAVFSIWGQNSKDEATRFAEVVAYLKQQNVISDYSQVALLLHSVRYDHSGPYLEALESRGIPGFCPRARAYFDCEEVRLLVACIAIVFGYYGDGRGSLSGQALRDLAAFVDSGIVELGRTYGAPHPLVGRGPAPTPDAAMQAQLDLFAVSGLEPLRAFIKQENRVVPVWFRLTPKCSKQPEFVERKMLAIAAKPVEARTAAPTPPKKPAESVPSSEARLPFDAPAAKSEDDDERKGSGRNKNNEETDKDKTIRTGAVRPKKASFGTSPRASTRAQKPQATSQRLGGRDEKPRSGVKSRGSDFPVGRGIPILSGRETANGSPRGIDSALLAVKFNPRPPLLLSSHADHFETIIGGPSTHVSRAGVRRPGPELLEP
jgi:superfamily I DNA/RNA helicase